MTNKLYMKKQLIPCILTIVGFVLSLSACGYNTDEAGIVDEQPVLQQPYATVHNPRDK